MAFGSKSAGVVEIKPANLVEIEIPVVGTAPYVQAKFSEKAKRKMAATQVSGSTGRIGKGKREARDFEDDYRQAQHISEDGWNGMPATAFRAAMIAACRLVQLEMTRAKMAVFVLADGYDKEDGTPLVKIESPKGPEMHTATVRNQSGVADLRCRPMWRQWGALVRIRYDADILTADAVVNLLNRAGLQVGIGEGRPFSKESVGQGWGTFQVVAKEGVR